MHFHLTHSAQSFPERRTRPVPCPARPDPLRPVAHPEVGALAALATPLLQLRADRLRCPFAAQQSGRAAQSELGVAVQSVTHALAQIDG